MTQPHEHPETSGNPRVDDAVARLEDLAHRPVEEHVAVFEDVHARLQAALQDARQEPGHAHAGAETAQS